MLDEYDQPEYPSSRTYEVTHRIRPTVTNYCELSPPRRVRRKYNATDHAEVENVAGPSTNNMLDHVAIENVAEPSTNNMSDDQQIVCKFPPMGERKRANEIIMQDVDCACGPSSDQEAEENIQVWVCKE